MDDDGFTFWDYLWDFIMTCFCFLFGLSFFVGLLILVLYDFWAFCTNIG